MHLEVFKICILYSSNLQHCSCYLHYNTVLNGFLRKVETNILSKPHYCNIEKENNYLLLLKNIQCVSFRSS